MSQVGIGALSASQTGQAVAGLNKAYKKSYKETPSTSGRGRKLELLLDPETHKPRCFSIIAPKGAAEAQAKVFLAELLDLQSAGLISKAQVVSEPMPGGVVQNMAYTGTPASNFPPNLPDGWCVNQAAHGAIVPITSPSVDVSRDNFIVGVYVNSDRPLAVFGDWLAQSYLTPPLYHQPGDAFFPEFGPIVDQRPGGGDDNSSFHAFAPGEILPAPMKLELFVGGGTRADYDAAANGALTRPYFDVLDTRTSVAIEMKDGAGGAGPSGTPGEITMKTLEFRMKVNGVVYVIQVLGGNDTKFTSGVHDMYNGPQDTILWGLTRQHPSVVSDGSGGIGQADSFLGGTSLTRLPMQNFIKFNPVIRQGDDDAGPVVNATTLLDDASGIPSTLATLIAGDPGSFLDQAAFDNEADRDKFKV